MTDLQQDALPEIRPEHAHLISDLVQIQHEFLDNVALRTALGDVTDRKRHAFHTISVDLAWQVVAHAAGVATLLYDRITPPLMVVQRALWEAAISVRYLCRHPDRDHEAAIFKAYSYIKEQEDFALDDALIVERESFLSGMDPDIVTEARNRARKRPHTWSGLKIVEVADQAGITGFDIVYRALSGRAHAHRAGKLLRFGKVTGDQQEFTLGESLTDLEVDHFANFARRGLQIAIRSVWGSVASPILRFGAPDPSPVRSQDRDLA
ncbi:MAG: DUF5677 domain-containing protein [Gemmatimonadales bacterium]